MKKTQLFSLGLLTLTTLMFSCGSLDEIADNQYTVSPNPLEVHGDKLEVNMTVNIPPRKFPVDQAVELKPGLIFTTDSGRVDTSYFDVVTFMGDNFQDNYERVTFNEGLQDFQYTATVDYKPGMENSQLFLFPTHIDNTPEKNRSQLDLIPLAVGAITTSLLYQNDDVVLLAEDTYKEFQDKVYQSRLNFAYNSSRLRQSEERQEDIQQVKRLIKQTAETQHVNVKQFNTNSYASPEGKVKLNQKLSEARSNTTKRLLAKYLNERKMNREFISSAFGADWKGFFELIDKEPSLTPKDKAMIKRSLDESPLLSSKERTLRSLMRTYKVINRKIFPELRRSEINVNYLEKSRTIDEIKDIVKKNPEQLTIEELLYSAKLFEPAEDKLDIYLMATEIYPNDYRTHNNAGAIYLIQEDYPNALLHLQKAFDISDNNITKNNLGIYYRKTGDLDKAIEKLEPTTEAKARYNLGLVYLQLGDYKYALENMESLKTANVGLLKILTEDYQGAINILNDEKFDELALAYYLKAIANVRLGETNKVKENLDKAFELETEDYSFSERYKTDLEFAQYKFGGTPNTQAPATIEEPEDSPFGDDEFGAPQQQAATPGAPSTSPAPRNNVQKGGEEDPETVINNVQRAQKNTPQIDYDNPFESDDF